MTATKDAAVKDQAALPVSREAILAQWGQMIAAVPDAEDDDGLGIIANVLQATDLDSLNTSGGLPEAEDFLGEMLIFRAISKRESTVEGSESPWYLVVEADTGAPDYGNRRFSTSSRTIMAQLVRAWSLGLFPMAGVIKKSDKPTKRGFYPLDIKFGA